MDKKKSKNKDFIFTVYHRLEILGKLKEQS